MLARVLKIFLLMLVFIASAGISTVVTIHLLIGSKDTVVVPDLEGKEIVYALEVLSDLELNTKVKGLQFSSSVPKHHVISQDPRPGSEIKKDRDVRLILSKGARNLVVPNLVGLGVPQARILLEENGLVANTLSYTSSDQYARDEIIAQYPTGGQTGSRGDIIDLLVSTGPPALVKRMLNVTGMGLNQAVLALEQHQLTLGAMNVMRSFDQPDHTVLSQSPAAGYPVASASAIEITLNRRQGTEAADELKELSLFRYRVPQGFLNQSVRVRISRPTAGAEIFDDYVQPAQEIWLLVPQEALSTLLLYVDDVLKIRQPEKMTLNGTIR